MTSNSNLPGPDSPAPSPAPSADAKAAAAITKVFLGPNGIRAGWRLLIFLALFAIIGFGLSRVIRHIPAMHAMLRQAQATQVLAPVPQTIGEGLNVVVLLICAFIMTKIEKRSFADYGLPARGAFGKKFWLGIPYGFAMLSLLLALIAAGHGLSLDGLALHGATAVKYGVVWAIGFVLVGVFEEFSFRGYMQATLTTGMGFWPAAILLGILFGAVHLGNSGEAVWGAVMAGSFGVLAAFSLFRTGTIWFAIGMHAAWDWAETYFYGVPDSGLIARGHLFNSSSHGARWLTGGTVGPEGSCIALGVLVLAAIGIHFLFPARQIASRQ
ncbi:MAG: CPBP family intramembrane glutamic endopeptidase [Candidatus Acidiferrales bacterium]